MQHANLFSPLRLSLAHTFVILAPLLTLLTLAILLCPGPLHGVRLSKCMRMKPAQH